MTINLEAEAATREENNVALIAALYKVLARGVLVAVVEVLQNLLPNLIVRVSHPHPLREDSAPSREVHPHRLGVNQTWGSPQPMSSRVAMNSAVVYSVTVASWPLTSISIPLMNPLDCRTAFCIGLLAR